MVITVYAVEIVLEMKTAPASFYLMKAAGKKKVDQTPAHKSPRASPKDQVREIAEAKMVDLNANDIDAAMKIIEGSARSMGFRSQNKGG